MAITLFQSVGVHPQRDGGVTVPEAAGHDCQVVARVKQSGGHRVTKIVKP